MPDQVLASLSAAVVVDGHRVTLDRGDEIPEGIEQADFDRLNGRGSIVTRAELARQAAARAGKISQPADATPAEPAAAEPDTSAGAGGDKPLDVSSADASALAGWIKDQRVTVADLVAAAGEDKGLAQRLLDAEGSATDGNPRPTAVKGLEAIIAAEPDTSAGGTD